MPLAFQGSTSNYAAGVLMAVLFLAVAVAGIFLHPKWMPNWSVPLVCSIGAIATGATTISSAIDSIHPLLPPLTFLLFAVPLPLMLDRMGFFAAVAARVDRGRDPRLGLWILAAAVTTFLNLDAAVVLLTPLYIRIARRQGLNVRMLAFQPVLLASLASSTLPVSNLTNLIATSTLHLNAGQFLVRLALPTFVSVAVGWLAYRRLERGHVPGERLQDPIDRQALRNGAPVVAFVVLGFTAGDLVHVPAWVIAAIADLYLLARMREVRVRDLPVGAAIPPHVYQST